MALESIRAWSQGKELIIVFGSPLYLKEKIYNCAFVLANGHYLGIVPKSKLNFRGPDRVYRGFSSLNFDNISEIALDAQNIPFGQPLLFSSKQQKLSFAVEIGTDAGSGLALKLAASGAQLVFNLAAIRKTVSSLPAWQDLMCVQSRQAQIAYLLQSGSPGDSTAESVLSDMSLGFIFGQRLRADKVCYDSFKVDSFSIDLDLLYARRTMMSDSLPSTEKEVRHITIVIKSAADYALKPEYSREPFLENLPLDYVCGRIFEIQSEALIKKLCSFPT